MYIYRDLKKACAFKKKKCLFTTQQSGDKTRITQFSYLGLGFLNRCDNRM